MHARSFRLPAPEAVATRLGLVGLLVYAFSAWLSTSIAEMAMVLMLLALALDWRRLFALRRDRLLVVSFGFGLFLLLGIAAGIWNNPAEKQIEVAGELFRIGFLPMFAVSYWVSVHNRRSFHVLMLALAGFLLRIPVKLEPGELLRILDGWRPHLGMHANGLGVYCAVGLLGLLLFIPTFWRRPATLPGRGTRIFFWVTACFLLTEGFVLSQSRTAWLGAAVVVPILVALRYSAEIKTARPRNRRRAAAGAAVLAAIMTLFLLANRSLIRERLLVDRSGLTALTSGTFDTASSDAVTLRAVWWRMGLEKWLERPFFGWGPGSVERFFTTSENATVRHYSNIHNDFHNLPLQLLVQVGLIGTAFFVAVLALALWSAWAGRRMSGRALYLLTVGAILLFLFSCMGNLLTKNHFGRTYVAIFGGIAYSYRLHRRRQSFRPC